jgi:hypothetical protein
MGRRCQLRRRHIGHGGSSALVLIPYPQARQRYSAVFVRAFTIDPWLASESGYRCASTMSVRL